jgi:hypothetical protein
VAAWPYQPWLTSLLRRAFAARRWDEAVWRYERAVELAPTWSEGVYRMAYLRRRARSAHSGWWRLPSEGEVVSGVADRVSHNINRRIVVVLQQRGVIVRHRYALRTEALVLRSAGVGNSSPMPATDTDALVSARLDDEVATKSLRGRSAAAGCRCLCPNTPRAHPSALSGWMLHARVDAR